MRKNNLKPYILLSILPLVYLSDKLETALFMGLVYMILALVIYASGLLIDKFSEGRLRLYAYLILAASVITASMTILNTYFSLNQYMGIYLALTLYMIPRLKTNDVTLKFSTQAFMVGVGFLTIVVIGLLRELLGTGSIELASFGLNAIKVFDSNFAVAIFKDASGGFILAGIVFGLLNAIPFEKEVYTDAV